MIILLIFLEEDIHPSSNGIQKDLLRTLLLDTGSIVRTLSAIRIQGYLQTTISLKVNHRRNEELKQKCVLFFNKLNIKPKRQKKIICLSNTLSHCQENKDLGGKKSQKIFLQYAQAETLDYRKAIVSLHHKLSSIEVFVAREMFKVTAALAIA